MYGNVPVVNNDPLRYVRTPLTPTVRLNDPLTLDDGTVTATVQPVRKPPENAGDGEPDRVAPPERVKVGVIEFPMLLNAPVPCCCGENDLLSVTVKLCTAPSANTPAVGDTVNGGVFRPGLTI